jgi:hypothetical protein
VSHRIHDCGSSSGEALMFPIKKYLSTTGFEIICISLQNVGH